MAEKADDMNLQEIRKGLEKTRSDLASTLDGIRQSFGRTRKRMSGRAEQTTERAQTAVEEGRRTGGEAGRKVLDLAKENPIPLALMGLGVAWLVTERLRAPQVEGWGEKPEKELEESDLQARYEIRYPEVSAYETVAPRGYYRKEGEGMDQIRERVGEEAEKAPTAVGQARAKAAEARERAREKARGISEAARSRYRASGSGFMNLIEKYPLAVGIGVAALGAVVGFLIPESRREQKLMGRTRDDLMERTKEIGRGAVDEARTTLRQAGEAAREEVEKGIERATENTEERGEENR